MGTAVNGRVFGGDFPIDSEKHAHYNYDSRLKSLKSPDSNEIRTVNIA